MLRIHTPFARFLLLLCVLFLTPAFTKASHIVGADLAYTHVTGSTYKVTLSLYGDCGPMSAAAFAALPSATPQVCVYDGGTAVATLTLAIEAPTTGTEITPLCPGAISQCASTSSTIPAVKKFVYSATYTVPHPSTVWRFIYSGNNGSSGSAGRAAAITNLTTAGSTTMQLIDTLNNSSYVNSSPSLAVTQATFFCLNDYNNYNPTAIDPDADVLSYSLIPATNGTTNCMAVGSAVGYTTADAWPGTPLSGATPIRVATGTFGFNNTTGQLSFYPNVVQRAVIIYNIREIRGGVLVGTSQREMTILVTGSCAASSPCSGTPTAGVASYGVGCASGIDTLVTTGSSCAGVTFQWQSSPDNATWTNIAGATDTRHPITPTASSYYRCRVTCISSGMTSYTGSLYNPISTTGALTTIVRVPDTGCTGVIFDFTACTMPGYQVISYFGDATTATCSLTPTTASVTHSYALPGTYTIKHVLYLGTSRVDSVTYSFTYNYCHTLPIRIYNDNNSNCVYDAGDTWNYLPVSINVDSAGTTVGTYTVTSGLFYQAHGGPGTIYTFNVTGTPTGLSVACPSTGAISDTILAATYGYPTKMFGLQCTGASGFDLKQEVSFRARPTLGKASILVTNAYCTAVNDTITMSFSPKYTFASSFPAASSVVGNVAKWWPGSISATTPPHNINVTLFPSGSPLVAFDTLTTDYVTTPITGDLVPANNTAHRVDTVFASFDPNAISVSPQGYISSGTELTYTIDFENMGNAPAENIHILDTLSSLLLPGTLSISGASHAMNLVMVNNGGYTVAKFDFPHINLPDTSHHNECHGMVVFKIKTQSGLAPGTIIPNRAGIYFDDNEVVMTNTVNNIILIPTSVPNVDRENVIVYPNPASTEIMVRASADTYSKILITNAIGRSVVDQNFTGKNINISNLQPGIYYVTLSGQYGTTTAKFIKL